MNSTNTSGIPRYLLYAIGEIALVVVGILIALQINNHNEARKERAQEAKLLAAFETRIQEDTIRINYDIEKFTNIYYRAVEIREVVDGTKPYTSRIDTSLAVISSFSVSESNYTVFETLKSIGVNLIKNDHLRNQIIEYYRLSVHVHGVERYYENGKYFRQHIYPRHFTHFRHSTIAVPRDFEKLKHEGDFLIALDYCINDALFYWGHSRNRKELAVEILDLIKVDLEEDKGVKNKT